MARQRLELGTLRNGTFTPPVVGNECVCCNGDTQGRTQDYNASDDRVQIEPFALPVCFACKDHALQSTTIPILQACALIVSGCLAGLGFYYWRERPGDVFILGMGIVASVAFLGSIWWISRSIRREKAERAISGHHPHLAFTFVFGNAWFDTTNGELVDRVLAMNPTATRVKTPLLWRKEEAKQLAPARVVKVPPRDKPLD